MENGDAKNLTANKLAEIERLIKMFKEKFEAGTNVNKIRTKGWI